MTGRALGLIPIRGGGLSCGSAFRPASVISVRMREVCGEVLSPWLYVAVPLLGLGVLVALLVVMFPEDRWRRRGPAD